MVKKQKPEDSLPSWPEIREQVSNLTYNLGTHSCISPFDFVDDICRASGECQFMDVTSWLARLEDPDQRHQELIWQWVLNKRFEILARRSANSAPDLFPNLEA